MWVAVPVARPTRLGVSHCPSLKVEQRRSPHENMYSHTRITPNTEIGTIRAVTSTYPEDIHCCFVFDWLLLCLRDIEKSKNKASSRHLFYICIPTHPLLLVTSASDVKTGQRYEKIRTSTTLLC